MESRRRNFGQARHLSNRPTTSSSVILIVDGLREVKVPDRGTSLRIALHGQLVAQLWLLGEDPPDERAGG
jgi:hypothetical protein